MLGDGLSQTGVGFEEEIRVGGGGGGVGCRPWGWVMCHDGGLGWLQCRLVFNPWPEKPYVVLYCSWLLAFELLVTIGAAMRAPSLEGLQASVRLLRIPLITYTPQLRSHVVVSSRRNGVQSRLWSRKRRLRLHGVWLPETGTDEEGVLIPVIKSQSTAHSW